MADNNGNRLIIPALILSALGVIGTVFLGIGFILNNGQIGTSQASAEEPPEETSWWQNARSALAGPCAKAVSSRETADRFLEACSNPTDAAALVSKGRALLITWNANSTLDEKRQHLEQIEESFDQAGSLATDDPEIAFYQAFVLDFKDFVLDNNNVNCTPAGERYEKAIQLYKQVDNITPDSHNLFIINELGHFLTNRDKAYKTAISLYDRVADDHPQIGDVLMSKATAQLLDKDYFGAKDSFETVLAINPEAYQIRYNLGSLWAQLENYEEALKYYESITGDPKTSNFYYAWRDQGISYYFLGNYAEAQRSFEEALKFEGAKFFDERNYTFMNNAAECLEAGTSANSCFQSSPGVLRATLRENGVFQGSVIVHNRNEQSDPFFEVEHDAFYKCNQV